VTGCPSKRVVAPIHVRSSSGLGDDIRHESVCRCLFVLRSPSSSRQYVGMKASVKLITPSTSYARSTHGSTIPSRDRCITTCISRGEARRIPMLSPHGSRFACSPWGCRLQGLTSFPTRFLARQPRSAPRREGKIHVTQGPVFNISVYHALPHLQPLPY